MDPFFARGSAVAVVAHPDDETIWMGGTILAHPHIRWTVLALSRGRDRDRAPRFRRACRALGARGVISDWEDEGVMNIRESVPEALVRLRRTLRGTRFTHLFTHGYNGEYGHPRHKGASRAVREALAEHIVRADRVMHFAYRPAAGGAKAVPQEDAPIHITLPRTIAAAKRRVIRTIYGFGERSFEYESAGMHEAFLLPRR